MRIILATIALALPASAQDVADFGGTASSCAPSPVVYAALETQFHEARVYVGLSGEAIIEIWRADTGTFTVLATTAGGSSCIIASGEEGRGWANNHALLLASDHHHPFFPPRDSFRQ